MVTPHPNPLHALATCTIILGHATGMAQTCMPSMHEANERAAHLASPPLLRLAVFRADTLGCRPVQALVCHSNLCCRAATARSRDDIIRVTVCGTASGIASSLDLHLDKINLWLPNSRCPDTDSIKCTETSVDCAVIVKVGPFATTVVLEGGLLLAAGSIVSIALTHTEGARKHFRLLICLLGGHTINCT